MDGDSAEWVIRDDGIMRKIPQSPGDESNLSAEGTFEDDIRLLVDTLGMIAFLIVHDVGAGGAG